MGNQRHYLHKCRDFLLVSHDVGVSVLIKVLCVLIHILIHDIMYFNTLIKIETPITC